MLFVAMLTHSPESCLVRPENAKAYEEFKRKWKDRQKLEKETGVKVIGAYVNSNEHTFFFILEANNYGGVVKFLGPPLLTYHKAKITPVVTMEEVMKIFK